MDCGDAGIAGIVGALGLLGTLFVSERGKRKAAEVKADAERQRADDAKASAERTRETAAEVEAAHVEGDKAREEIDRRLDEDLAAIAARPKPDPTDLFGLAKAGEARRKEHGP